MTRFVADIEPQKIGLLLPAVQKVREAARRTDEKDEKLTIEPEEVEIGLLLQAVQKAVDGKEEDGVILFFDEADSLYDERTDSSDAHDSYANLEVSHLLGDSSTALFGEDLLAHEVTHVEQDGA